jgi:hypothetical protein
MENTRKRLKKADRKPPSPASPDWLTERLDFTVQEPPPTPRLSLNRHYGARYADDCWVIEPGGAIQFRLNVSEPEHTLFALEVYSSFDEWVERLADRLKVAPAPWLEFQCQTPDFYNPVLLTIGNEDLTDTLYWVQRLNPLGRNFNTNRLILAPAFLFPGDNFVTLWLSNDAGVVPMYLKSVSVSDFGVQRQQQTEWCWAAVTSSLIQFMIPEAPASQRDIVTHTIKKEAAQSLKDLNKPWDITDAAKHMGLADSTRYGNVSRDTMREMVNEGLPIPIQINWRNNARKNGSLGSGHYVVVNSIGEEAKGETLIQVEDPLVGKLSLTWDELKNDYPGKGNQHLYQHKERQRCGNWQDGTCRCRWRGKWTYTHVLIPKDWMDEQPFDLDEYEKLLLSGEQRLAELAERDRFEAIYEQAKALPQPEEVNIQIENLSLQVVKLNHQIQDLTNTLEQLEDLRQYILSSNQNDSQT